MHATRSSKIFKTATPLIFMDALVHFACQFCMLAFE